MKQNVVKKKIVFNDYVECLNSGKDEMKTKVKIIKFIL